ncbi:MAG: hypothetical protein ACRDWE_01430 [Acidimicrobiales bacterium]
MTLDEMDLLGRLREVPPLTPAVADRARVVLQASMAVAAPVVGPQPAPAPFRPHPPHTDDVRRTARWHRHRVTVAVAGVAAAAVLAVGGLVVADNGGPSGRGGSSTSSLPSGLGDRPPTHGANAVGASGTARHVLYRLASVSISAPALQGRYMVLDETDSETGYPGVFRRTSVVDTRTGSSVTYQQAYTTKGIKVPNATYQPGSTPGTAASTVGPPTQLTSGPDPASTAAWYAALPTDPVALRAKLLTLATHVVNGIAPALDPTFTDDDYVYEEADTMLWSPLVPPALRSALYKVLAGTSGYTVTTGTDPSGRAAIVMTRTYTGDGETDVTYENPSTGAVLAQVWQTGNDVISAVYQPVTATTTIPPNPYSD